MRLIYFKNLSILRFELFQVIYAEITIDSLKNRVYLQRNFQRVYNLSYTPNKKIFLFFKLSFGYFYKPLREAPKKRQTQGMEKQIEGLVRWKNIQVE